MAGEQVLRVETSTAPSNAKQGEGLASAAYARLRSDRDPYLVRARRCAEVTIPSLFPPDGNTGASDQVVPWNTLGAFLVGINLGPKLKRALFPDGVSPALLTQDTKTKASLREIPDAGQREELSNAIDAGLVRVEQDFASAIQEDGDHAHLSIACKKLIVGGNHAFQFYPEGTLRGISLERFVTRRDPSGNLLEFCIEDPLAFDTLPPDLRARVQAAGYNPHTASPKNTIMVFTWGYLRAGLWEVCQEVYGIQAEASHARYTAEALPYLFVPFELLPGEDYGRSYVENYEGDLQTVEGGTQTITEGSAAMARFLLFVHPGGLTSKKAVAEAANGATLTGRAEDVTALDVRAANGNLQSQQWVMEKAMERLQRAFLVSSRRQGERVTAEEIRADMADLQEQLGAVYDQQVTGFQTPYIKRKLASCQRTKRLPPLPKGTVKVTVIGGLAALGRAAALQALDGLFQGAETLFGPEAVAQVIGPNGIRTYFKRRAVALGVNTDGLLPSEAEVQQMEQEKAMMGMVEKLGPEGIKQVGNNLTATEVADTNASVKMATAPQQPPAQ